MNDSDERFRDRWSRLKRQSRQADRPTKSPVESPGESPVESPGESPGEQSPPENPDAVPGSESDTVEALPDIDSLDGDSDYTAFLREGVPEDLKHRALRKLWRSDPVLANLDGLNDYDEDFGAIMNQGAEIMRRLAAAQSKAETVEAETPADVEADTPADAEADTPTDAEADTPMNSDGRATELPAGGGEAKDVAEAAGEDAADGTTHDAAEDDTAGPG